MKTAELLRATTKTLLHNRVKIFTAAIVFHMFSSAVSSVAFNLWFELVLKASGRVNITIANLSQIFSNPLAILISIIFAVVVAFLLFLEFTVLSFLIYSFRYGKKIRFRTMLKNAFKELKVLASPQVILLVLLFISMIPLSGIAFSPFLTEKVSIPRFIIAEIIKTSLNLILLIITGVATLYVNFRLIFTLPLMILTPKSFAKSARISWRMSGENQTSLLVIFTMIEFVAIAAVFAMAIALLFTVELLNQNASSLFIESVVDALVRGIQFIVFAVAKVMIIGVIIELLAQKNEISHDTIKSDPAQKVGIISLIIAFVFAASFAWANFNSYINYDRQNVKIVAHRGGHKNAVENSLESIDEAKKAGAQALETDIKMTADGEFVIFHDLTLRRMAGINRRITDMTLAEIRQVELKQGDNRARIPTLEEFIHKAQKNQLDLFLELKVEGSNRREFLRKYLAKAKKIGALKYRTMAIGEDIAREFKRMSPKTRVGSVIPFQLGKFDLASKLDFFAIEDFSYDQAVATEALLADKEVFVWTVNDYDRILKYMRTPNSGVITDEPNEVSTLKNN